ncbi:MAG: serine/threonine protein kinase [Polyangiaceae bacterium]|nr:serine/threonine protein kinase [Polyangiaceae bacterium]MBK8937620.1 serine/threonine protein kinase [Polyangiaceae bacterium]
MRSDDIHPGDVIGGKYRVRAIVSRVPTLVVDAFHVEFDQRVVIKLLLAGTGDDKEIERFRREARVLSKLESEHAARIIDVGTQSDGSFYLVRQHVEGEDLAAYVQAYGPRPLPEAVLLILQAAECVSETHGHGIVLRELSPANIMVARRASGTPLAKITDFGTAKLMRDNAAPAGSSSLTATALFGLSPFSSPELVRKAKSVDHRADVWSLGAVLYFMLAGRPPFGGDVTRLMLAITREEPTPLTSIRGDLPPDIDNIIGWAMAKDIDRRFKNVHSLAHALGPYAPAEGQVLIERIAQIAHQAKQRKAGAAPKPPPSFSPPPPSRGAPSVIPPPPSHPVAISASFDDDPPMMGDDEATHVLGGGHLRALAREITAGIPGAPPIPGRGPTPQPMGLASRGLPVPPPPPSIPPSPFLPNAPKIVPPRGRSPSIPDQPPRPELPRFDTAPPAVQQMPRPTPRKSGLDMRIVWGALAATAVMAPVVLLLLLKDAPPKPVTSDGGPVQAIDPNGAVNRAVAGSTAAPGPDPMKLTAETSTPAQPTAVALATNAADTATPGEPPPPRPTTNTPPPRPTQTTKTTAAPPPPPPPPPPKPEPKPETGGGGKGRLLAIASGGTCAFSVDGAGKSSGSSLSMELPAGKHTVTCKPTSGTAKSRGVTIKPGETSMLTFKL